MAEGAQGRKEVEKIRPPLFVLGNVSGGHRAHRQMKRGSHPRCFTDAKGSVRPDVKESARTIPAYELGSCLQAQRVWRKSRLRLR